MRKYIDVEKIPWTDLNDGKGGVNVYVTFLEKVARMPAADVVEVVRCKDCKHWDSDALCCSRKNHYIVNAEANDYCSYGERKNGDEK